MRSVSGGATVTAVVIMAFTLALTGCRGNPAGTSGSRSPSPAAPPAGTPDVTETEKAALNAYEGMWFAFAKAGETADHKHPQLRKYARGKALSRIVAALLGYREEGLVTRGRPTLNPELTSLTPAAEPTKAGIEDCGDSTNWKTYRTNGEEVPEPTGRRRITATVVLEDGVWKVTDYTIGKIGSCAG